MCVTRYRDGGKLHCRRILHEAKESVRENINSYTYMSIVDNVISL